MGSKHWRLQSREDFEELLRAILAPLIPHYSQGGARLKLGATAAVYDQGAVWAEALPLFIRSVIRSQYGVPG